MSAAALFAKGKCRDRAAQFQRGAAGRDHRSTRDRSPRYAQATGIGGRDRPARAIVDRGEREAAGMSCGAVLFSLAPHLRGRDERSSLLEGWGEGLFDPQALPM